MKTPLLPCSMVLTSLLLQGCGSPQPPAPAPSQAAPATTPQPTSAGPQKSLPLTAYAVEWGTFDVPSQLKVGQATKVQVALKNTSPVAWPGGAGTGGLLYTIRLSHRWLRAGKEVVSYGNIRAELPTVVNPGQSVVVETTVTAPAAKGRYQLQSSASRAHKRHGQATGSRALIDFSSHAIGAKKVPCSQPAPSLASAMGFAAS